MFPERSRLIILSLVLVAALGAVSLLDFNTTQPDEQTAARTDSGDAVEFVVTKWNGDGGYFTTENPAHLNVMKVAKPYDLQLKADGRDSNETGETIHLLLVSMGERKIENVIYSHDGRQRTSEDCKLHLQLSGDEVTTSSVDLDVTFDDGVHQTHSFNIWRFPRKEYEKRGLPNSRHSRIVLEESSIQFVEFKQARTLEWWDRIRDVQGNVLSELSAAVALDVDSTTPHSEIVERVITLMNRQVWKGTSRLNPAIMTPTDVWHAGNRGERVTSTHFNTLAALIMRGIGVPTRLIIKISPSAGPNFSMEGNASSVEYYDRTSAQFVYCNPWLSLIRIETPKGRPIDTYEFVQLGEVGLANMMTVIAYDPAADEIIELRSNNTRTYDPFTQGFPKPYPLDFAKLISHVEHYTRNGSFKYLPIRTVLDDFYRPLRQADRPSTQ